MELKEIFNFCKKFGRKLFFIFVLGSLCGGVLFFIIPEKFLATGILYISRTTEESEDFYTYSGYYAQQVALSYTNTVRGLLESEALQAKALEEMQVPLTKTNLKKLGKKIRIKDAGPQLVEIEIKDKSPEKARETWEALSQNIQMASLEINNVGDPKLQITRVKEEPVIKETYKELYVFTLLGGLIALGTSTLYFALETYMKGNEND